MQIILAMLVAASLLGACKSPLDPNIGERATRPEETEQRDETAAAVIEEQKAVPDSKPASRQLLDDEQPQR
jgi:hypothetical protein